jgi:tetratricopeptide (TPR) repeat protein
MVVSQSPEAVAGFRQLSTLQEQVTQDLTKNPDDSAALALRGEIRLNAGQLAPAYADLRRALELNPAPETRRQLLGSLLEGLRIDFATYRQSADEIERFIETPEQRGNYYRLLAAGLQQAGERQAAFDVYLKLAAADAGTAPLLRLSEDLSVRRDRWVQAQLGELYAQASAADKAEFDRKLERQWEELRASEDADRVRAFLTQIGRQPIADDVRRRLVELLLPEGYTLEVEHELCLLERSSRPELAGFATAHLAAQLLQAGCVEEAAAAVARLGGRFADVVCLENRTGKQWAEIWADDPKLQAQRAAAAPWPAGPLVAEKVTGEPASSNYRISIPLEGRRGPFFDDRFLAIDQRQQRILGLDGLGREVWELPNNGLNVYFNATGLRARALNHLVLLASATQVLAVDTLGTPEDRKPRPIWRESLVEGFSGDHNNAIGNVRQVPLPGGGFKIVAYGQNNQPLGELGVIQPNCICVQRGRLLLGLDPRNGQLLWQRFDAPRGGELFGDDEFVFVMAPQATEALVYRISDGQHVGNRPVPAANVRLKHFDRYVLSWAQAEENQVLSLLDVWSQKVVWKHAFALGSRLNLVQDEDVAILEPGGRFATVRLQDGQMALDSKLDANGPARQIFVLRSREFDILLSGTIAVNQPTERAYAFGNSNIVFTGTATCFQRFTGEKLWDRQLITQGLDLSLPPDLPLLIFATRHQKTNGTWDYQLQCLDKRTGKTILDLKDAGVMNILEASGDRTQKRVALSLFGQTTLQYQFTFLQKE